MIMRDSFEIPTDDVERIAKEIIDAANSSETLDDTIKILCKKYDAESMMAGILFHMATIASIPCGVE